MKRENTLTGDWKIMNMLKPGTVSQAAQPFENPMESAFSGYPAIHYANN